MATKRMLIDVVHLFNYVGEINDVATYQETILKNVYCPLNEGTTENKQGRTGKDSATLYIFDMNTKAVSKNGKVRTYLPYEKWIYLDDKSKYWTIGDYGQDYFVKEGHEEEMQINSFSHKTTGTRRMWHMEVKGG